MQGLSARPGSSDFLRVLGSHGRAVSRGGAMSALWLFWDRLEGVKLGWEVGGLG